MTSVDGETDVEAPVEAPRSRWIPILGYAVAAALAGYYLFWHIWLTQRPLPPDGAQEGRLIVEYPFLMLASLVVGPIASVVVTLYVLWLLRRYRRWPVVLFAVLWGFGSITLVALSGQVLSDEVHFALVPALEDLFKAVGVVLVALAIPTAIRGPVTGGLVGWMAGVGYSIIEDIQYATNNFVVPAGEGVGPTAARTVFGALTFGHALYAACVGVAVGLAVARGRTAMRIVGAAALGLVVSIVLHYLYNTVLLVGAPLNVVLGVAMLVYLYRTARRTQELSDHPVVSPSGVG